MFGSTVLEVAIGVVFVYLVLSLLCTAINEAIATLLNKRGKNLFEGIKNLLNDPKFTGLAQQLYYHGLVDGISQDASRPDKPNRLPAYMPSNVFSLALIDILRAKGSLPEDAPANNADPAEAEPAAQTPPANTSPSGWLTDLKHRFFLRNGWIPSGTAMDLNLQNALDKGRELATVGSADADKALDAIAAAVRRLPAGHTKESLFVLIDKTKRDVGLIRDREIKAVDYLDQFDKNVQQWFNEAMDRVSGWYKRWTQTILFGIGLFLVIVVNADTVMLVQRFTRDSALRAALVSTAENVAKLPRPATDTDADTTRPILEQAKGLQLPLGWSLLPEDETHVPWIFPAATPPWEMLRHWIFKVIGLLITVVALSLGAPFWFDTLSKLVNLRGAGTPPGDTKKSAAQPKQAASP